MVEVVHDAALVSPAHGSGGTEDLYEYLAQRHDAREKNEHELEDLKAQVRTLKQKLDKTEHEKWMTTSQSEAQTRRWQKDEKELEKALWDANARAVAATHRCDQAEARASEQRARAAEEAEQLRQRLQEAEHAAAEAEREMARLRARLSEEQIQNRDASRKARVDLEKERSLAEAAEASKQETEARLGRMEEELRDAEARAASAERKCALLESELASKPRASAGTAADELQVLRKELQAAQADAAQAKVLRQHVANVDLLREQLAAEEARCRRLRQEADEAASARVKLADAEELLSRWKSAAAALGPGCESPDDVPRRAAEMQREALKALERQGQASKEERLLRVKLSDLEAKVASLEAKEAEGRQRADGLDVFLARERRKVALLEQECGSLKRVLASYESEAPAGRESETAGASADEAQATISLLKAEVRKLEAQVVEKTEALAAAARESSRLKESAAEAKASAQRLAVENERLGEEVAVLGQRLGRGEFDRRQTKVLHLIANPEAAARKEAEESERLALEAERDALAAEAARLQAALAAAGAGAEAAAPDGGAPRGAPQQVAVLEAEKVVLQRRAAEAEKRELRLKEVFRERIQAFREACYQLFGYRVDMASEASSRGAGTGAATSFVLRPAKADSKDDHLVFRFTQAGGMEIQETPFTAQPSRQQEVQTFIAKFRSIPAFTANLTMELFQKQTQC